MEQFEETSIWIRTLAPSKDSEHSERTEAARKRLRDSFHSFRERAAQLAQEIPQNLRTLTVHDVTHLDALWEMADIIAGEGYEINPAEAYVLGGAFLLHDLGMSLSSYQGGIDDLKKQESWNDVVFNLLQRKLSRNPTVDELSSPGNDIETQATEQLLRNLHAKHAANLAKISFHTHSTDSFFLIEDVELRRTVGGLIGEIAYSHWWPIDAVAKRFSTKIGSFTFGPRTWTIDQLKIACLLRCSDACHLDNRRAPSFLMALRKPTGIANLHWTFQEHLQKPTVEHDRLVFSTMRPFPPSEHKAWWLCYETLKMADQELRQCNAVLADFGRVTFQVQGVAGSEDPQRLQRHVSTFGWEPIDINVRVSDVPKLVKKLGGASLYGENPLIPLRELVQNACDALRARRVYEDRPTSWGEVKISLENVEGHLTITVSDNGVGMTRSVLVGPFLDFGESYWLSSLAQEEIPGLARKGFEAVGGFGIGFYSAFMWGDDIKIVTRSRLVGPSETLVLHFQEGLEARPILRFAESFEQLSEPGTTISIKLQHISSEDLLGGVRYSDERAHRSSGTSPRAFAQLCAWLCPAADSNVSVSLDGKPLQTIIHARDWESISADDLIRRVSDEESNFDISKAAERVTSIIRGGRTIARLGIIADLISDRYSSGAASTITAGTLRSATPISGIAGLCFGIASTASRMSANSLLTTEELRNWANGQVKYIKENTAGAYKKIDAAAILRMCGADLSGLLIAEGRDGFLSFDQIINTDWPDEVILVQDAHWYLEKDRRPDTKLCANTISVAAGWRSNDGLPKSWHFNKSSNGYWHWNHLTLSGAVIEALAVKWQVTIDQIMARASIASDEIPVSGTWAERGDGSKVDYHHLTIIRRPNRLSSEK